MALAVTARFIALVLGESEHSSRELDAQEMLYSAAASLLFLTALALLGISFHRAAKHNERVTSIYLIATILLTATFIASFLCQSAVSSVLQKAFI